MGTKHLKGFVGLGPSKDAVMVLGGALLGEESFLRPGKAGRAPTQNQVGFIPIKLYVVRWRNWEGVADGKSSKSLHVPEGSPTRSLWWPQGWGEEVLEQPCLGK